MTHLKRMLADDEKPMGGTRLHWIYTFNGAFWFLVLSLFGIFLDDILWRYTGLSLANFPLFSKDFFGLLSWFELMCIVSGFIIFMMYGLKYVSTVIWVTDKRLIYKTGLIFIKIKETDLQEVKEEKVDQGWFGSILDYGAVHMDCRFVHDIDLPNVRDPLKFIKTVYKAREHIGREVVIE